ncbi:MAG: hypothetical protein HY046_10950 [Acidobacteria bacterium]|nr:hypothetical protein [Acidobacteriota bacterium]
MTTFEDMGKQIDDDIERLKKYLKEEVRLGAERKSVDWLRKAAEKLSDAAAEIERRTAKSAGAAAGANDSKQGPA